MHDIRFIFAGEDSELQRKSVPMLARCFEEWQMFQAQFGNRFPFREISFAALNENDEIVGHVGIMPFDVSDGKGGIIRMAGIASVGTAPEYRKRGIAAKLCRNAADWAQKNGFDVLPLYTSFFHVYESCGWNIYHVKSVELANKSFSPLKGKKGADLNADERKFIIDCYRHMPDFCGKVIRTEDNAFHGWDRIFRETFFDWYVDDNGYAVSFEGVLAEFCTLNGDAANLTKGIGSAFLSRNFSGIDILKCSGWQLASENREPLCWHGENVMTRNIKSIPPDIFFSLTDKF